MKKNYGSALVDYIVPTALIGLVVGTSMYYLISNGKLLNFIGASANMEINTTDQMGVIGSRKNDPDSALNQLTGGSLGGTADTPVKQCNDGQCDIDYGEFVLAGIPENFSDIVQASGTSGGTDQLISLAAQIADQLEQEKPAESLEIRKFASIGHNIAVMEKEYEKIMNSCKPDVACVKSKYGNIPKPAGYDESFYNYSTWGNIGQVAVGTLKLTQTTDPNWYNEAFEKEAPSALFVDKYQSLMNSNLSDTSKGVLEELYWQIGKLSQNVESGLGYIYCDGDLSKYDQFYPDPVTGEWQKNTDLPADPFDIYSNYAPSSVTHVDSALICAAGYNKDTGTKCH